MGNPGSHVYITWNRVKEPEVFYVEGPYDQDFIDWLKEKVPQGARTWDREKKVWKVQKEYLHIVKQIALNCYKKVLYSEGGDFVTL